MRISKTVVVTLTLLIATCFNSSEYISAIVKKGKLKNLELLCKCGVHDFDWKLKSSLPGQDFISIVNKIQKLYEKVKDKVQPHKSQIHELFDALTSRYPSKRLEIKPLIPFLEAFMLFVNFDTNSLGDHNKFGNLMEYCKREDIQKYFNFVPLLVINSISKETEASTKRDPTLGDKIMDIVKKVQDGLRNRNESVAKNYRRIKGLLVKDAEK